MSPQHSMARAGLPPHHLSPRPSLTREVRVESLALPRAPPSWAFLSTPGFGWPGHWPLTMASGGCRPGLRPQRRFPLQLHTQALRGGAVHDPASSPGSSGPKLACPLAGPGLGLAVSTGRRDFGLCLRERAPPAPPRGQRFIP